MLTEQEKKTLGNIIEGLKELDEILKRAETSMEWMVADMKRRADETLGNSEDESGYYSDELTEAAAVLEELREVNK